MSSLLLKYLLGILVGINYSITKCELNDLLEIMLRPDRCVNIFRDRRSYMGLIHFESLEFQGKLGRE